jgi:dipeptidyl aminopeptidase/acylaminoacyl peptidase
MKTMRWVGLVALVAAMRMGVTQGVTAATTRAMTFADLMAMKRVSDPQVSPSGRWVLFSVTDVSLEKNTKVNHLWVVPLGGGGEASTNAGVPRSAQNDTSREGGGGERQVTFGDGESFGRFSPDGKTISLTMKDQLFEMPWDDAKGTVGKAIQVTNVHGGADGAIWSPDSKRLMFVSEVWPECSVRDPTHDGETVMNGAPDFVVGGTRAVGGANPTRDDKAVTNGAPGSVAEPVGWAEEDACDKAKDAAADKSAVKGQVWEGLFYRHWDHYTGAKRSHVLVVDADSGRNLRDLTPASAVGDAETPTFSLGGPLGYAWAPDSKEIAYVTNLDAVPAASTNNDVFTLRLDEVGAKAVKVSTSLGSDDGPAYSPDGRWLAWRSQERGGFESDKFRLVVMDRGSESASQQVGGSEKRVGESANSGQRTAIREVMPKFDGWVDEFTWLPDSNGVYFASGTTGEESIFRLFLSNGELQQLVNVGEYGDLRISPDGEFLIASRMTLSSPTEINVLETGEVIRASPEAMKIGITVPSVAQTGLMHLLSTTHINDDLMRQLDLSKLEPFWFAGAEGTKVEGFLLKPPGFDPAKKYPVKFLMHGGPQTAWGDSWSYRWNWELMAASGYVVIGINRRGSTGYGQKFVDEVSGDWGGRAYEDLMKGLDYAEAKFPFIDKTRECALGASYGGFMADWVLTHTDRFKCIVTHDGMYDPESAWGDTEEMWFNEWEFRRPEDFPKGWDGFRGGKGVTIGQTAEGHPAEPWRYAGLAADQDPFRRWSPMRFIQNAKTPTLVIHSQKDYRLDVSQGMALFTALQRLGVPSKMLYFPDEGHWVLKPQNSQVWNEVVGDWCDRWTKTGKYADAGMGSGK